jgi:hypothetical protein
MCQCDTALGVRKVSAGGVAYEHKQLCEVRASFRTRPTRQQRLQLIQQRISGNRCLTRRPGHPSGLRSVSPV